MNINIHIYDCDHKFKKKFYKYVLMYKVLIKVIYFIIINVNKKECWMNRFYLCCRHIL